MNLRIEFLIKNHRSTVEELCFSIQELKKLRRQRKWVWLKTVSVAILFFGDNKTFDRNHKNWQQTSKDFNLKKKQLEQKIETTENALLDILEKHYGTETLPFPTSKNQN